MAGENLYTAMQGLNYTPAETIYGVGTQVLGQAVPQMINPYGSVGSNLGIALGGALLQSLGAYQARKEAADLSMQSNRLGLQLLRAATPEERLKVVEDVPTSFMSSDVQNRLLGLNAQLLAREDTARNAIENAVAADIGQKKALAEFYSTPEGAKIQEDTLERLRAESLAKGFAVTERSRDIQESIGARQEKSIEAKKELEQLKAENPDVPTAIWSEAVKMNQTANMALDVASDIEKYKSTPEFLAAKNLSAFGDAQTKSRLKNLASLIIKSRSGTAASDKERQTLESVIMGDFTAVTPNILASILKKFADDERTFAANTVASSTQKPSTFVEQIKKGIATGQKVEFGVRSPDFLSGGATTTSAPPVNKDEGRSFLLEMKGKYGADWKKKMKPEEKERAVKIIQAAKGQ